MSNSDYIQLLNNLLANTYGLYLKTQSYHWHITGPNFYALHKLFEEQYTEYAEAIDEIAERIRTLDAVADASFAVYAKNSTIADPKPKAPAHEILEDLVNDNQKVLDCINAALPKAKEVDDEGTINLLAGRISVHEKNMWMLKVSAE